MKNNFVSDLRKDSSSSLPFFTGTIEKVMNLYKEQEMIGASERLVFVFRIFYILLRINRLSVVVAWVFFLAT